MASDVREKVGQAESISQRAVQDFLSLIARGRKQRLSNVLGLDGLDVRPDCGSPQRVQQLSDVPRPRMLEQNIPRGGGEPLVAVAGLVRALFVDLIEEVVDEKPQVARALAQRWQLQNRHRQPIVQIFPKPALGNLVRQRAVGGGDHAHVHAERPGGTDANHLSFLHDPEQLHLRRRRQLPDFVEKQCAAAGSLEVPLAQPVGARECTLLVAEELRFHEIGRESPAVDGDEGAFPAWAGPMHGPRHQFLARSRLALDEDRNRTGRHTTRPNDRALHDSPAMKDGVELGCFRGETGAQSLQIPIRSAQEIGQIIRRNVEGHGGGPYPVLP